MGLLSALGKRGTRMLDRPWPQVGNVASPIGDSLTVRQRQILELAGDGLDAAQISRELRIPIELVDMQLSRANGKIGANPQYRGWNDGLLPPGMF